MNSNIYTEAYLQIINNSNRLNRIKSLIIENKSRLTKRSFYLINKVLFKKYLVLEENNYTQDQLIIKLEELIENISNIDVSQKVINKIYNIISNCLNEKDINKLNNNLNNINSLNGLKNYFSIEKNIDNFFINLKTQINIKLESKRKNKDLLDFNDFKNIFIKIIIISNNCKPFFDNLRERLFNLNFLNKDDNSKYYFTKENLELLFNNTENNFKNIILDSISKAISSTVQNYNNISTKINKVDDIYDLLLTKLDPISVNDIILYKNIIETKFNNIFYDDINEQNTKVITLSDFLSKEETKNIINNQNFDQTKLPYFPFEAIKTLYPIKISTASNGGQAELLLSILLPGGSKNASNGDIMIYNEPAEVKNLNNKDSGAKLNGQQKDQHITLDSNKNFLVTFLTFFKDSFNNKVSEIKKQLNNGNTVRIQEINKLRYLSSIFNSITKIKSAGKESNILKEYNIATYRCKGFTNIITNYIKVLNILKSLFNDITNINKENIQNDIKNAFIAAFNAKYQNIVNSNNINEISEMLAESFIFNNLETENPEVSINNLDNWHTYFGFIELKSYLLAEESTYFICTYLDNDIHIFMFDAKYLANKNIKYSDIISLFNSYNITFNICDFSDAGSKCACSIKLMK